MDQHGKLHWGNMRHRAKFPGDRCEPLLQRCGTFRFFSKWWLSAILDLLYARLEHPRKAFDGLYHSANFSWNQRCGFDNFASFNAYSRPQNVFRGTDPKREAVLKRSPKGTFVCGNKS